MTDFHWKRHNILEISFTVMGVLASELHHGKVEKGGHKKKYNVGGETMTPAYFV